MDKITRGRAARTRWDTSAAEGRRALGTYRFIAWLAAGSVLALALLATPSSLATPITATFTVDSTQDAVDANPGDGTCATAGGGCTVRAAVQESNVLAGANAIEVPAGIYQLTIPSGDEDTVAGGDLDLEDSLTIAGAGSGATIVDGGGLDRVIELTGGLSAALSGMTIRNGNAPFSGGGIQSGGDLTLDHVVVTANTAPMDGGGISSTSGSSLSLMNSVVSENHASRDGGGVLAATGSVLTIENSTIAGNSASGGGGLLNRSNQGSVTGSTFSENTSTDGGGGVQNERTLSVSGSTLNGNSSDNGGAIVNAGSLTIVNSTISGNTATVYGGGISTTGSAEITNVTIAGNSAQFGGALDNTGTALLKNTILEGGASGGNCYGAVTSLGHNISQGTSCQAWLTQPGDVNSHSALLEMLQDNGGPTFTHALMEGSPALDAGDPVGCPPTDQRGALRPQGAACDIGAFEAGELPPTIKQGDVDCDGQVTPRDALILLLHAGGLPILSQTQPCAQPGTGVTPVGDVNCDEIVDGLDAAAVLAFAGGLPPLEQTEPCTDIGSAG